MLHELCRHMSMAHMSVGICKIVCVGMLVKLNDLWAYGPFRTGGTTSPSGIKQSSGVRAEKPEQMGVLCATVQWL